MASFIGKRLYAAALRVTSGWIKKRGGKASAGINQFKSAKAEWRGKTAPFLGLSPLKNAFFYNFNVEVTGAAQFCRAAAARTAGLNLGRQHKRREAAESCAGTACDALRPPT